MPMLSIPALYDGGTVRLLEEAPVNGPYRVLVTFVEPAPPAADVLERFMASFGAWQDEESVEATIAKLRDSRRSKVDPPAL
jgi:hypothetical protein